MSLIKVALIYGGRSGEHAISCVSALAIYKKLDRRRYHVVPIAIDLKGEWYLHEDIYRDIHDALPVKSGQAKSITPCALKNLQIDIVFPVLHGRFGEDGTLQGLLEMLNIAYVGAGVLASSIGMDKAMAKIIVAADGIQSTPFIAFNSGQWQLAQSQIKRRIAALDYPLFVKPMRMGSSVGMSKVMHEQALNDAVVLALQFDHKIIVEQGVDAREIECAVLENIHYGQTPHCSLPGEIIMQCDDFYSFDAKYQNETAAQLMIPATLPADTLQTVQAYAQKIFTVLNMQGLARVDLFIEKNTGHILFNEINTMPGFTETISMYPKLWQASGLAYQDLLNQLIDCGLKRFKRKKQLKILADC